MEDAPSRARPQRRAVAVEGWTHRVIACAARPGSVPAAVPEAGLMPDEHLAGAEPMPVRASRRRVVSGRRLY